ncbi:hypothetical protein EG829_23945, partial [bacterium]|nr:hypothetical protein [bacterium]
MRERTWLASVLMLLLLVLFSGQAFSQGPVLSEKKPQVEKAVKEEAPVLKPGTVKPGSSDLMSPNPFISVWGSESPEGPFAGDGNC